MWHNEQFLVVKYTGFVNLSAKVLWQTAKTCQYVGKNAFFCGKVHFLCLLGVKRNKRWVQNAQQGVNLFRNGVNVFRKIVNSFRKWVNLFRNGDNFFRNRDDLFRKAILRNSTFRRQGVVSLLARSSVGVLSVEWGKVYEREKKRQS